MKKQAVNILFLGGAKRVSMGQKFIAAGKSVGMDVALYSYELTKDVPIATVATVIAGLKWNDPDIMEDIHRIVEENQIDIIIPFVDPAVEIAAKYCESDQMCYTPFRNNGLANILFDKIKADQLYRKHNFPLPADANASCDMIIAKPRYGSASKGIITFKGDNLNDFIRNNDMEQVLLQRYYYEREEYSVDCFISHSGEIGCIVPRKRIDISGGEVMTTITIDDHDIQTITKRIIQELSLEGAVTLQFLREKNNGALMGQPLLMEINPRLGGGAVCAVCAGANIPLYILKDWATQSLPEHREWNVGVKICRYLQEVVFQPK